MEPGQSGRAGAGGEPLPGIVVVFQEAPSGIGDEEGGGHLRENQKREREEGARQAKRQCDGHGELRGPRVSRCQERDVGSKRRGDAGEDDQGKCAPAEFVRNGNQEGHAETVFAVEPGAFGRRLMGREGVGIGGPAVGGRSEGWVEAVIIALVVVVLFVEVAIFDQADRGHHVERFVAGEGIEAALQPG